MLSHRETPKTQVSESPLSRLKHYSVSHRQVSKLGKSTSDARFQLGRRYLRICLFLTVLKVHCLEGRASPACHSIASSTFTGLGQGSERNYTACTETRDFTTSGSTSSHHCGLCLADITTLQERHPRLPSRALTNKQGLKHVDDSMLLLLPTLPISRSEVTDLVQPLRLVSIY